MNKVRRTMYLKKVEYFTNRKNFHPEPIDEVLRKVLKKLDTSETRHSPALANIKDGDLCHFVNRTKGMKNNGQFLGLEVCTYISGYVPQQFVRDFSASELPITPTPILDENGKKKEVAFISYVVAKGETLAVQIPKGSGGINELEHYLTWLIRNSGIDEYKNHPCIHLLDVLGKQFAQTLKAGGGAEEVKLNMVTDGIQKKGLFSKPLQQTAHKISGATQLSLTLKGGRGKTLADKDVIELYEKELGDFDGVIIQLKNGGSITTGKYKVKAAVDVDSDNGNPKFDPMHTELTNFLVDQMKFQTAGDEEVRLIDENGKFV